MAKHTIETLTDDLSSFKKSVNKRFSTMNSSLKAMQPQIQEMHDFIIDTKGYERGRATVKKDGSISFDPRVFDVIKWLALAVLLAVGGAKYL